MEDKSPIYLSLENSKGLSQNNVQSINKELRELPVNLAQKLINLNNLEDALQSAYTELGYSAGQGLMGINALREGKRIFNNAKSSLQEKICDYEPLRIYCEKTAAIEGVTCAGLILGGLLATKTQGIDVVSVSIILSRVGIKKFCQSKWQSKLKD